MPLLDEGEETFTLKLMNPRGAAIGDGEATGTIENSDPLQGMWLARFGRTVVDHVTAAISDRLVNPLVGAQVTVGGRSLDFAGSDDAALTGALTALARASGGPEGPAPGGDAEFGSPGEGPPVPAFEPASSRPGRELLPGSAFHLVRGGDGDGPGLAAWGRVTRAPSASKAR